jgi:hypothetical protein
MYMQTRLFPILVSFSRVRSIKNPSVRLPNDINARVQSGGFIPCLKSSMKRIEAFGAVEGGAWKDQNIQRLLDFYPKWLRGWLHNVHQIRGDTAWSLYFDRSRHPDELAAEHGEAIGINVPYLMDPLDNRQCSRPLQHIN